MTQREIKKIKRSIAENGAREQGYYCSIKNEFSFDEMMSAITELMEQGLYPIDFLNLKEAEQDDILITELIRQQSYQDFKNKSLEYIMC